jgi:hypothetical protein
MMHSVLPELIILSVYLSFIVKLEYSIRIMYFKQSASSSDYGLYHDDALPAPSAQKGSLGPKVRVPQTAIYVSLLLAKLTVNLPLAIKMALSLAEHTVVPQNVHIRIPFPGREHHCWESSMETTPPESQVPFATFF